MRMGRRPILSRAAMSEPSRFMMMRVTEPSIISCACRMPSTRDSFWLMSAAISSVELTSPELIAMNCPWWLSRQLPMSSSVLLMASTVAMAYVPSCERTSRGWGSLSLMQPMALVPWKSSMSRSKRVRNGAFSMEWIWRWKPRSWSSTTMPARRVPRCE